MPSIAILRPTATHVAQRETQTRQARYEMRLKLRQLKSGTWTWQCSVVIEIGTTNEDENGRGAKREEQSRILRVSLLVMVPLQDCRKTNGSRILDGVTTCTSCWASQHKTSQDKKPFWVNQPKLYQLCKSIPPKPKQLTSTLAQVVTVPRCSKSSPFLGS